MKNEWRRFSAIVLFLSVMNGLMVVPACRSDQEARARMDIEASKQDAHRAMSNP
jgi:hypothetical protein